MKTIIILQNSDMLRFHFKSIIKNGQSLFLYNFLPFVNKITYDHFKTINRHAPVFQAIKNKTKNTLPPLADLTFRFASFQ